LHSRGDSTPQGVEKKEGRGKKDTRNNVHRTGSELRVGDPTRTQEEEEETELYYSEETTSKRGRGEAQPAKEMKGGRTPVPCLRRGRRGGGHILPVLATTRV